MRNELALSNYERQEQLYQYVKKHQRVTVAQICDQFGISEATARRDLTTLADQGKLQRVHGGALAVEGAPPELPVLLRANEQSDEKARIGQAAADLVRPGETIYLGSGTTALAVAQHLREHRGLTVITNSVLVINALADAQDVTVIGLGGLLRRSEMSLIGHITEQALAEVRADKVILGIRAIDPEQGLTNDYLAETMTDRAILNVGKQIIVVADHSKCGRVSTAFVAPVTRANILVTDSSAPEEFVQALVEKGIQVILA